MTDAFLLSNLLAWSLQVTGLVATAGALPWLLRLHAPAVRHHYWRLIFLAALALPVMQVWEPVAVPLKDVPAIELSGLMLPENGAATPALPLRPTPPGAARWPGPLALLLAGGAVIRLAWLGLGLVRLRRLRLRSQPSAREEPAALGLEVPADVDVRFVPRERQPITFGIRHPVVLLPWSLRDQPAAIRRAVIEHELWHVRRRDWQWVVLEELVRSLLWFHPAIHWLISRIQLSREEVVDELTVLSTNGRREYLEALLAFADEPSLYPAAPFARRCHLFHRMLLISREAVMSSRRIVATCAAMGAIVVVGGWYSVAAFPLTTAVPASVAAVSEPAPDGLPVASSAGDKAVPGAPTASEATPQSQPRDLRPGEPRPVSQRERDLRASVTAQPTLNGFMELATLQEARGAANEAEATLSEARIALPGQPAILLAMAQFYNRTGRFDDAIEALEQVAGAAPSDPRAQHLVATFYEEKVRKDSALSQQDRLRYTQSGIAAEDRALALDPDYVDAMIVKNILLRHHANLEPNDAARAQLMAEADDLRNRAMELQRSRASTVVTPQGGPPSPRPPFPPVELAEGELVDGMTPLRVGGNIAPPMKTRDVRPVYPPDALAARVSGVVIIEATIDSTGSVQRTRVLRSIPMLDEAALEAVRQWTFTPTHLNGAPMPVIMTVTVNFTLQ